MAESSSPLFGPVAKLQWLEQVARERLTAAELAIAAFLANRANNVSGRYFHSFDQFTDELPSGKRALRMAVANLLARGVIIQPRRGNGRGNASEYQLNLGYTAPERGKQTATFSENERGKQTATFSENERGKQTATFSVKGADSCLKGGSFTSKRGKQTAPHLIHKTDSQSVLMNECDGRDGAPVGARPSVNFEDAYPWFWAAFPFKADVAAVEAKLSDLAAAGAPMAAIEAGAQRYSRYVAANPRMRMAPVKWLEGQRWRDDWMAPLKPPGKAKGHQDQQQAEPLAMSAVSDVAMDDNDDGLVLIDVDDIDEWDADGIPTDAAIDALRDENGILRLLEMTPAAQEACYAWTEKHCPSMADQPYAERMANEMQFQFETETELEAEGALPSFTPWSRGEALNFATWLYRKLRSTEWNEGDGMDAIPEADIESARKDLVWRLTRGTRASRLTRHTAYSIPIGLVLDDFPPGDGGGGYLAEWKAEVANQKQAREA